MVSNKNQKRDHNPRNGIGCRCGRVLKSNLHVEDENEEAQSLLVHEVVCVLLKLDEVVEKSFASPPR